MRLRRGAIVLVSIVPFAALSGCGGTVGSTPSGATGDAGVPPDATTMSPGQHADDAGQAVEDATTSVIPSDATTPIVAPEGCASGHATLSGTLYDPAGNLPLPNAVVYILSDPQAPLAPLTAGTGSCSDSCTPTLAISANTYIAATETNVYGGFTLDYVATGNSVTVVFQLGKWRRKVTVDTPDCANTTVPPALSRLPRNQSEGDIPRMALVTGACDELACLMRDIGLDAAEFTGPTGGGRLHVYKGAGAGPDLAGGGAGPAGDCSAGECPLWSTKSALEKYDLVLLGCECGEHNETKPDKGPLHDWLDEGGRVLATHYQSTWFKNGPADFQGVASWTSETDGPTAGPFQVDSTFVGGNDLQNWLRDLASLNADGTLALTASDVSTSVSDVRPSASRWIYDTSELDSSSSRVPKLLSFATPVGGLPPPVDGGASTSAPYCGRAFFTDVHAGGGGVPSSSPVPASCAGVDMSAQEKALEYAFFYLSGPCYVEPPVHPGF